jgi:hypothetical protein
MAVCLGLAPAGEGGLEFSNARFTEGVLGPVRASSKVLPGDSLVVCFDVSGIRIDDHGKVRYSTALEVTDSGGKSIFKQDAHDSQVNAALGGDKIPAFASVQIGLEQPAGEYTLKVTVADPAGGGKATLSKTFEVLPKAFGLVQLSATADAEGLLPVPTPGAGQGLWLHGGVVGFARDNGTKQPNISLSVRVLDEAGKPTFARPGSASITKGVASEVMVLPVQMPLLLNRAGKYTVEITAKDEISGQKDTRTYPLTVAEVK